jgi:hypothetical protein
LDTVRHSLLARTPLAPATGRNRRHIANTLCGRKSSL